MKKVLVTGAAGYIGSILCGYLIKSGYSVIALDSLLYDQKSLLHLCKSNRFNFIKGDVRDKCIMKECIAKADVIIPLAAIVGAPACKLKPYESNSVNLESINLLNKLRSKSQTLIYPATESSYGFQHSDEICTEKTILKPNTLYAIQKANAEEVILCKDNSISIRLATAFGVSYRMRFDLLVNNFVYMSHNEGSITLFEANFKRSFVHVCDIAECFCFTLSKIESMVGNIFNLTGEYCSKKELAEKVKNHFPNLRIYYADIGSDPDKRNYFVSAKKLLLAGFKANRNIDNGIIELKKACEMLPRDIYKNI